MAVDPISLGLMGLGALSKGVGAVGSYFDQRRAQRRPRRVKPSRAQARGQSRACRRGVRGTRPTPRARPPSSPR